MKLIRSKRSDWLQINPRQNSFPPSFCCCCYCQRTASLYLSLRDFMFHKYLVSFLIVSRKFSGSARFNRLLARVTSCSIHCHLMLIAANVRKQLRVFNKWLLLFKFQLQESSGRSQLNWKVSSRKIIWKFRKFNSQPKKHLNQRLNLCAVKVKPSCIQHSVIYINLHKELWWLPGKNSPSGVWTFNWFVKDKGNNFVEKLHLL